MAIERARSVRCTAMQIFVKNNMQWFARPLTGEEIHAFLNHVQRGELSSVFGHANYLINLATTNPQFHANSIRALAEELVRADQLGLPFLVMHPGAHLGAGEEGGFEKDRSFNRRRFSENSKSENENRARNYSRPGFVHRSYVSSILRTSSRTCANRSGCACASTPRIFSRRVTTSAAKREEKDVSRIRSRHGRERLVAIHLTIRRQPGVRE